MIDCLAQVSVENDGTIFDQPDTAAAVGVDDDQVRITVDFDLGVLGQSITVDVPIDVIRGVLS